MYAAGSSWNVMLASASGKAMCKPWLDGPAFKSLVFGRNFRHQDGSGNLPIITLHFWDLLLPNRTICSQVPAARTASYISMFGFGGHGYGLARGPFEANYRCYPVTFIDKPGAEKGDKIFLPPSALDRLCECPRRWHLEPTLLHRLYFRVSF